MHSPRALTGLYLCSSGLQGWCRISGQDGGLLLPRSPAGTVGQIPLRRAKVHPSARHCSQQHLPSVQGKMSGGNINPRNGSVPLKVQVPRWAPALSMAHSALSAWLEKVTRQIISKGHFQ